MVTEGIMYFVILICLWVCYILFKWQDNKMWWLHYKMKPHNFPFRYKGKILWYSRSCAVASFVFAQDKEGTWHVLANKRGKGAADYKGMWNCCTGYMEFNSSGEENMLREIEEEVGLELKETDLIFYGVNTSPESNKQNIVLYYYSKITKSFIEEMPLKITGKGEKDEVEAVAWIPINKVKDYTWAFDHDKKILNVFAEKILQD